MGFYCEAPLVRVTGLIVEDYRLYTGRHRDRLTFEAFGGKAEIGEHPLDALYRELHEEAQIKVNLANVRPFGKYLDRADGDGRPMLLVAYLIEDYEGTIARDREIAEIRRINSESGFPLGSTLGAYIVPQLVSVGLIH